MSAYVILNYLESLFELKFGFSPLDRLRERYHRGRYSLVKRRLIEGSLLDIGCGRPCDSMPDGAFLLEVGRGVGLDIKPCRGSFEFRQGNAEDLPFPDAAFENVVAMEVLEHVDDLSKALSEIDRVLRPGGVFVITVPDDNLVWHAIWRVWTSVVGRMWRDAHKVLMARAGWAGILAKRFDVIAVQRHWYFDLVFFCRKKGV